MIAALLAGLALAGPQTIVVESDDLAAYTTPTPAFVEVMGPVLGAETIPVYNLHGDEREAMNLVARLRADPPETAFCTGAKACWTLREHLPEIKLVHSVVLSPGRYGLDGYNVSGIAMVVDPTTTVSQFLGFFPDRKRIGVFRGPNIVNATLEALRRGANAVNAELVVERVSNPRGLREALHAMRGKVDAVWLQADRDVLDPRSWRTLIEETRRLGLPVIVETEAMVRAGATFAMVHDPVAVGQQAADQILSILGGQVPKDLGVPYPKVARTVLSTASTDAARLEVDPLLLDFVDVRVE